MSADQNQHYLPQSYQRGWSDASGRPHVYRWVHDRLVCEPKATKATGGRDGLYFIPMAPPGEQNMMEDRFWKLIDQWGADGLALLRSNDPAAAARLDKDHLATFINSFLFRNPNMVEYFNVYAKKHVLKACQQHGYAKYRQPHEPATFEEFQAALDQPGMTEFAAQWLRYQIGNKALRDQLLTMEWQVVTAPPTNHSILTSDVPVIINSGLKNDDGCLILPLSANEFFVAYNLGGIDMKKVIGEAVADGSFIHAMNKYVIEHRIGWVYGRDDSLMAFVAEHWGVSQAPYFPMIDPLPDSPT